MDAPVNKETAGENSPLRSTCTELLADAKRGRISMVEVRSKVFTLVELGLCLIDMGIEVNLTVFCDFIIIIII